MGVKRAGSIIHAEGVAGWCSIMRAKGAHGWSFYIFSGSGSADELFFRDLDLEFFEEFGVVGHFLA